MSNTSLNTMRQLLERWSELEPTLCEKFPKVFTIRTAAGYTSPVPADLSEFHLAWIQWAVQAAIIERGWYFEVFCSPTTCSVGVVEAMATKDNLTEALLSAYLQALEK